MPYVKSDERVYIDNGGTPRTPGELNYTISRRLEAYWYHKGESYQTYNDILGALEGAKLELYRTLIGPYETSKALTNGALSSQPDLAWAAGFFDGEGNTNHTLQRDRRGALRAKGRAQLTITQKSPLLLLRFKEAVGGIGYIRPPARSSTCWHYTVGKFDDLLQVILLLWPYLGHFKRDQALGVLRQYIEARDLRVVLPDTVHDDWPEEHYG